MTRLEFTLRELGEIYDFAKAIRRFRIVPAKDDAVSNEQKGVCVQTPETTPSPEPKFDTPANGR